MVNGGSQGERSGAVTLRGGDFERARSRSDCVAAGGGDEEAGSGATSTSGSSSSIQTPGAVRSAAAAARRDERAGSPVGRGLIAWCDSETGAAAPRDSRNPTIKK